MNFYNNSLSSKKYLSLIKKIIIMINLKIKNLYLKNQAMLMGDKSFYRILKLSELFIDLKG